MENKEITNNFVTIIGKIKNVKREKNITNLSLSEMTDIPVGTLNKILSLKTQSVKMDTLNKIITALNIDINGFYTNNKQEVKSNDYGFVKVGAYTIETKVADINSNISEIKKGIEIANDKGVDVLVFSELTITGYTLGDLFYQQIVLENSLKGLKEIVDFSLNYNMLIFVGLPYSLNGKIYNVASVICKGKLLGLVPKTYIPNYNEFYEKRQFCGGENIDTYIDFYGEKVVFSNKIIFKNTLYNNFTVSCEICEDAWVTIPPSKYHSINGSFINVNLSASNEVIGKQEYRKTILSALSGSSVCGYVYANAGTGESTTDVVFSGHNLIIENGKILEESKLFTNGLIVNDIDIDLLAFERSKLMNYNYKIDSNYHYIDFSMQKHNKGLDRKYFTTPFVPSNNNEIKKRAELILDMQANGLAKRIKHINCKTLVIGVSGGLDSTLALLVAKRAMEINNRNLKDIIAVTMPCFGTTKRTKSNATILSEELGVTLKEVNITDAVKIHFRDIGQSEEVTDVTYENCQARERTQVLMDIANKTGGIVVGTGDLSELALGWATYNGDHMSMYGVNCSIPKTLIRYLVNYEANNSNEKIKKVLLDILDTPVSPELVPPKNGEISQKTEDIVGPYLLHDFYLYYAIRYGFKPSKIYYIAKQTFNGVFTEEELKKWLVNFYNRFFNQQFKRSCLPDGVKVGSVSLSPRGDWRMPSDAVKNDWLLDLQNL